MEKTIELGIRGTARLINFSENEAELLEGKKVFFKQGNREQIIANFSPSVGLTITDLNGEEKLCIHGPSGPEWNKPRHSWIRKCYTVAINHYFLMLKAGYIDEDELNMALEEAGLKREGGGSQPSCAFK